MHAVLDINIPNYASAVVTTDEIGGGSTRRATGYRRGQAQDSGDGAEAATQ